MLKRVIKMSVLRVDEDPVTRSLKEDLETGSFGGAPAIVLDGNWWLNECNIKFAPRICVTFIDNNVKKSRI